MNNRVNFPNIRKELVTKAFALRCTLHQTRNIRELKRVIDCLLRIEDFDQIIHPRIIHFHDTHVLVNRRERVVRRFHMGFRDRIKQG